MKLIYLSILLMSTTSFAVECELYRSGSSEKFEFKTYSEISVDDYTDPACIGAMSRSCAQVIIRKSTLLFPEGVAVEYEARESEYQGSRFRERETSTFRAFIDEDEFGGILKKKGTAKLWLKRGKVMSGGYSLECRE